MVLIFYKLSSAIERGTKPDVEGWQPCPGTRTGKAARGNASRAGQDAHTRGMPCLPCLINVSRERPVATSLRSGHAPRGHSVRGVGAPSAAWQAPRTQPQHALLTRPHPPLPGGLGPMGGGPRPRPDPSPPLAPQTPSPPNHPALVRPARAAPRRRAPTLPAGIDPRAPRRVDDAEHGGSGHEDLRPVLRGLAKAQEPRARRKLRPQRPRGARQPAIKRAVAHACAGMEEPPGAPRTGPEARLKLCGERPPRVIDLREPGGETIYGGHPALLAGAGWHRDQRGGG